MDDILLTICCRAGSNGLKNKHLLPLQGKPLVMWTIETALEWQKKSRFVDQLKTVVISTDSPDIIDMARSIPCDWIDRPIDLAKSETPKMDAIRHACQVMQRRRNVNYQVIVDLDATNPLRTVADIDNSIQILRDTDANAVVSVVKARKNPYFNQIELDHGFAKLSKPSHIHRRQDVPAVYDMNASILVLAKEFIEMDGVTSPTHTNRLSVYEMPEWTAFDIDSYLDFQLVEYLLCLDLQNGNHQR